MTRAEIESLRPGQCVIGFAGISDELPLVRVDASRVRGDGLLTRFVAVQYGHALLRGSIVEDEPEIISSTAKLWPDHITKRTARRA